MEACCKPRLCKDYRCVTQGFGIVSAEKLGSTEDECCQLKKCEEYSCSSATRWEKTLAIGLPCCLKASFRVRKPNVEETEDGGQKPRMGFSDEANAELKTSDLRST